MESTSSLEGHLRLPGLDILGLRAGGLNAAGT